MALAKKKELAKMTIEQLDKQYTDLRKELMKLNMQKSSGTPPENPGLVKATRKAIARIHTFKTQKKNQPKEVVKKSNSKTIKKEEKKKK
ncbi:50S ribosomal protein L29 [Candidatus Woesearchaeota archaeon]|jgi:ribosomal protein L29|nr:50S ribosomal protein L29 [Candidatus Woesearchaeota archaeon]MBT6044682.1 50S ribosomal protein L29 [Candidatus Woesearchaeota archaeon]